ncbi:hypothetical protein Poli38472_000617 [Pythium oligandrum]|uniref:Uncharacterized protein n=1 Tax=Pythium oligandrum TaxID=41045 RepID=A0A8K1CD24_PYTOL|nr:hypothetical protein Poli38472_000617 [Pythium oligandrum]|eukprot:TMW60575.1 hypothetical protein Poli38472_000617 [Pythium oligandrum]
MYRYSPLVPPRIESIAHKVLVKWAIARKAYEDEVAARCVATEGDVETMLIPVKATMHFPLLAACCRLQWDITVEELMEERLRFELDKIISSGKSHSLADILPLFTGSLRMVLDEPDVNARVLKYFMDCDEIVSKNDLTSTFSSEIGQQMKCTILTRHLEPSQLREKVEGHQEFVDRTSETDERALFQLVLEKPHEREKEFQLS